MRTLQFKVAGQNLSKDGDFSGLQNNQQSVSRRTGTDRIQACGVHRYAY